MHRGPPICVEGERVLSPINGFAKIATCCNQSDSAATNSGVLSHRGGRINNPFLKYGVGMVKTGKVTAEGTRLELNKTPQSNK